MAKILIVDDEAHNVKVIAESLQVNGHAVVTACDGVEGLEALAREQPDLVIVDVMMPRMNGFEMLRKIRVPSDNSVNSEVPVIILTAFGNMDDKVESLRAGANDYLTKPIQPRELLARVHVQLRAKSARDRLRESHPPEAFFSDTDELTGSLNRWGLMERLRQEMSESRRHARRLCCVMVDVDHFRQLNETHGQPFGDHVLRELGEIIGRSMRLEDVCGRTEGDTFVVLLPSTPLDGAVCMAERLSASIAARPFPGREGEVFLTVSVGIAIYPWDGAVTEADLLALAKQRLDRAKRYGRNCIVAGECP